MIWKSIIKVALSIGLVCLLYLQTTAQKKNISLESVENWISLKNIKTEVSSLVTNNGKYLAYEYGSPEAIDNNSTLVIQSIDGKYKQEFKNRPFCRISEPVAKIAFTQDDKHAIFMLGGDTLAILRLGTTNIRFITKVNSFELPEKCNGRWLAYVEAGDKEELNIVDLFHDLQKKRLKIDSVINFKFNLTGDRLFILSKNGMIWYDLNRDKAAFRFKTNSADISQITFDKSNNHLAFIYENRTKPCQIMYYRWGTKGSLVLINGKTKGIGKDQIFKHGELVFSSNGNKLYFEVEPLKKYYTYLKKDTIPSHLKIWDYRSDLINRQSEKDLRVKAVTDIRNPSVIHLTTDSTTYNSLTSLFGKGNHYVIETSKVNDNEFYWNNQTWSITLTSVHDGTKKLLKIFPKGLHIPLSYISPLEKFVVWFDETQKQYFSYEIETGQFRVVSSAIKYPLATDYDIPGRNHSFGIVGWMDDDRKMWIYDRFDIWQIDLTGKVLPVNITHGYGRKSNVILRSVNELNVKNDQVIDKNRILLSGFHPDNKKNGLFLFSVNGNLDGLKETLGDWLYCNNESENGSIMVYKSFNVPQKANKSNTYIVRRMSSDQSPNLFVTKDFIKYDRITDIRPELFFNWIKSELVQWELPDGRTSLGMLYKPENFDPTKKYPVIFHFYEKRSDELNAFLNPDLSYGNLNIPWYVSNGYLVFVPDIQYKVGDNAASITSTITSAVNYLKRFSFIDFNNMGLQGHSFGGYETLVLISKTHLFKAAQQSAGICDLTNEYSFLFADRTRQNYYDFDQGNMGEAPWNNPPIYIKNSPIYDVGFIETPLLILHSKDDDHVSFNQSYSMYAAMRRLKKPVWLLQYDEEWHWLHEKKNKVDFTMRQQQFFDHYLKNKPIPEWMLSPSQKIK
jgi:dipeptidyl aminopeptidase/acylaminoacyl peptidase